MEKYVVRHITRPAAELICEFEQLDTSTVYEAQGRRGLMAPYLKPATIPGRICGPAVTVLCHAGDNLMIHAAIEVCQPGDIVVIGTIGESVHGMIGELIVKAFKYRGAKGIMIDAGIRDVAPIREMGFPIWSKAVHSLGANKTRGGWVNSRIVCGGTNVTPGDIVIADEDGIVIVPQQDAVTVLEASKQRMAKEEGTKLRIDNGELSLDYYNLREVLQKENVVYYDSESQRQ